MASPQKIEANRRNAKRSTGPHSYDGKARSRRNAWRHGLAACAVQTGSLERELGQLTAEIAGPDPDAARWHFAKIAAEAEYELRRVRTARGAMLAPALDAVASAAPDPNAELDPQAVNAMLQNLSRLDRYERRAISRRNRALHLL